MVVHTHIRPIAMAIPMATITITAVVMAMAMEDNREHIILNIIIPMFNLSSQARVNNDRRQSTTPHRMISSTAGKDRFRGNMASRGIMMPMALMAISQKGHFCE
jgi:hypothetical protein